VRFPDGVMEFIAPTRCAGCDDPGALVCAECESRLQRIGSGNTCLRCGAPLGSHSVCGECVGSDFAFDSARCVFRMALPLSRMITVFKDGGERRLAGVFGSWIADIVDDMSGWTLCPVPSSNASGVRTYRDSYRRTRTHP